MEKKIRELIPEFDLIEDNDLKQKTLNVWVKAIKQGGWTPDDLPRIPFTLLLGEISINYVEHIRGVTKICAGAESTFKSVYGDRMAVNKDYLIAGALLHDIGKLVEYAEENGKFVKSENGKMLRHPFSGVGLCYDEGIPPEIMHMIALHSKEGDGQKRSPESVIIHHADFMNFETLK